MKTIKFNAHRSNTLLGMKIRFYSRGLYNHISIDMEGFVYEAHWFSGVRKVERKQWDDSTVVLTKEVQVSDEQYQELLIWMEKQVGKAYDFLGITTFLLPLVQQGRKAWFCSELAMALLIKMKGKRLPRLQRVSPQQFVDIAELVI